MHVVEISQSGEGLSAPMAQMRTWLDHHRIEPLFFELALLPERKIRFRLQFREASEAAAFTQAFQSEGFTPDNRSLAA
jgi:hypothetical protein